MNKEVYITKLEEAYIEEYIKYQNNYAPTEVGQEFFLSIASYIELLRNLPEGQFSIVGATKAFFGMMIYAFDAESEAVSLKANSVLINSDEKQALLKRYFELAALSSFAIYMKTMANSSVPIDELMMESEIAERRGREVRCPVSDYKEYLDNFHCRKTDILMLEDIIGTLAIFDEIMGRELKQRNSGNWLF